MTTPKFIIVDGADGSGKTTLINALKERLPSAHVHHHVVYPELTNMLDMYLDSFVPYLRNGQSVILDRSWLDEPIYGKVMRDGADRVGLDHMRMLNRVAAGFNAQLIICRTSLQTTLDNMAARINQEYVKDLQKATLIYTGFNLHKIRALVGGVIPTTYYNYKSMSEPETVNTIVNAWSHENKGPGIGKWYPGLSTLLIGESPGPTGNKYGLPFIDTKHHGCSSWLIQQLQQIQLNESKFYWINAYDVDGTPTGADFINELRPQHIIALGNKAASWCHGRNLKNFRHERHPQNWKQFHYNEPYPLIDFLKRST